MVIIILSINDLESFGVNDIYFYHFVLSPNNNLTEENRYFYLKEKSTRIPILRKTNFQEVEFFNIYLPENFDPYHLPEQLLFFKNEFLNSNWKKTIRFFHKYLLSCKIASNKDKISYYQNFKKFFKNHQNLNLKKIIKSDKKNKKIKKIKNTKFSKVKKFLNENHLYIKFLKNNKNLTISAISRIFEVDRNNIYKILQINNLKNNKIKKERKKFLSEKKIDKLKKKFLKLLNYYQEKNYNLKEIRNSFCKNNKIVAKFSHSWFYFHFIKKNNISFKIMKYRGIEKKPYKSFLSRILTVHYLKYLIKKKRPLIFFDEMSIEIKNKTKKIFCIKGQKFYKKCRITSLYLKILMLVDLNGVIAFNLTEKKNKKYEINHFLSSYFSIKKKYDKSIEECSVLILDNAPKHRNEILYRLRKLNHCNFSFIPPLSSPLNFIENIFNILKKKVKKKNPIDRYVQKNNYRQSLVKETFSSILQLDEKDFQKARNSYFYEIYSFIEKHKNVKKVFKDEKKFDNNLNIL